MDHVKGYDFYESDDNAFQESECFRFLRFIELQMADHLRRIIKQSVDSWVDMLAAYDSDREASGPSMPPIFRMHLNDAMQGDDAVVVFKSGIAEAEACLQQVLGNIVAAVQTIPTIDSDIMTVLQPRRRPVLNVGGGDPACTQTDDLLATARAKISSYVEKAFENPRALAQEYEAFLPVMVTSPEQYLDEVKYLSEDEARAAEEAAAKAAKLAKEGGDAEKKGGEGEDGEGGAAGEAEAEEDEEEDDDDEDSDSDNEGEKKEEVRTLRPLVGIRAALQAEHDRIQAIIRTSYDQESFPLAVIVCDGIKSTLVSKCNEMLEVLHGYIIEDVRDRNENITQRYNDILTTVSTEPRNEEELVELAKFVEASETLVSDLQAEVEDCFEWLGALGINLHDTSWEAFRLAWSTKEWPKKLLLALSKTQQGIENNKQRMLDKLEADKEDFERELASIGEAVKEAALQGDIEKLNQIYEDVCTVATRLQDAAETAASFRRREAAFNLEETEYSIIAELESELDPYLKLWSMTFEFRTNKGEWIGGSFLALNAAEVSADVTSWWTQSYKLNKTLADSSPAAAEVAMQLRAETTEFRKNVPLIEALGSPALRDRHWEALSLAIGHDLIPDMELTLESMVNMDIMQYLDKIDEVTMVANKEFALQKKLKAMNEEWAEIEFVCSPYTRDTKEPRTSVVGGTDDIIALLDDQIVGAQGMLGSSFIAPIYPECKAFERKLIYIQAVVDEWLALQRGWMYLEPIFSSPDILRQMPTEGRRFQSVDALWRGTMAKTLEDPSVMAVAENETLLANLKAATEKLDTIQKHLDDYLETKALVFPRFFFLSNDELLEILSQTKDPRAVQPYLGKCFEGLAQIKFAGESKPAGAERTPADDVIMEIRSAEREEVPLVASVDPNQGNKKGAVEIWLLELEASMRLTIKDITQKSMEAYPTRERKQWVFEWPGQVILSIGGLYWTREVETALNTNGLEGIKEYFKLLTDQLMEIVALVRGKPDKMALKKLGALTVVDVHQKDVVETMIRKEVCSVHDFEWMSQLRYYWEEKPDDYNRYGDKQNPFNLLARIINAEQMYGYEYLGCSSRLIITPLTDRCYRTLMGAISLTYGGAPAGPAGTGKTETTKDLAKAVAIQCVVMNCSDGLDYLAMAKFFKGLAQSGAWACFDEFNRIDLEVLSVIAQQILTIQDAKRERVARFMFMGTQLQLNPDCNVFITMNPGYAGRSELPDNLAALFRPCAMMVPDYAMIGEIKLYSFGFMNGKILARKLTQVLKLSSELLSNQKHYDYGMRAVFSILVRAGNLRQDLPDWTEEHIVFSAVMDVNLPKFTSDDLPLFKGITTDLFPGVVLAPPDYGELIPEIIRQCALQQLQPKDTFVTAVVQLFETVQVRHGLMVVGLTMSGKSGVYNTLARSMTKLDEYEDVVQHVMNPKSITSGQLYGNFDPNTHEWSDGILAELYRRASKDSVKRNWVLFDGPVDAVWIENMNTVLDDNRKLCLVSGEIIKMSPTMTMMFEAEDLEEASPATVSRVGMVYLEPTRLGPDPLLESWLQYKLPASLEAQSEFVRELFHWAYLPMRYCVRSNCAVPTPISDMELAKNLLLMFSVLLHDPFVVEGGKVPKEKDIEKTVECVFFTAVIWSLGVIVDEASRKVFDLYMRQLCNGTITEEESFALFHVKNPGYEIQERSIAEAIPEEGPVYDYYYDANKLRWIAWASEIAAFKVPGDATYSSILVPTLDTHRNQKMMHCLALRGVHILITGATGTGKSVQVKQLLTGVLDQDVYVPLYLNFSAQTSENMTQDIIDGKLGKRRKGIFGPPPGKRTVVFVDDLNMPKKEEYGAQPPVEILRQWMCQGGWYDRKELVFRKLIDLQFIAAMGPPGGGRTQITQRYVRHYLMINLVPFDDASLSRVFNTIIDWHLAKGFAGKVKSLGSKLVDASISLYKAVSENMRPSPLKSHYTFNLRDLSKVFQGLALSRSETFDQVDQFARLWVHESRRVFADRLVDEHDRELFQTILEERIPTHFNMPWQNIKGANDTLVFGNYIDPKQLMERRVYAEIEDHVKLKEVMDEYLEDYNQVSTTRMDLVLFMSAMDHLSRIARVVQLPGGNALLVGVGGSGRKSLTALAVSLSEMKLFQIEISKNYGMTEWREDLKRMFMQAGKEKKHTVFLFSDTQVVMESFIEDINNILNTGEVPNIFNAEERAELQEDEKFKTDAKASNINMGNVTELMAYFTSRVQEYLHVVLAFSPIADIFRQRLMMFPALINCCTIDWFAAWPEEALLSVATKFLADVDLEQHVKDGIVATCVDMQSRVTVMSDRYKKELERFYYVTPTSYLELINTFKGLISIKRGEVLEKKHRYENGLQKLFETNQQVNVMEDQLRALQPKLKEASIATEAKLKQVQASQEVAEVEKSKVQKEEKTCADQASVAEAQASECTAILSEAMPALAEALSALNIITKNDLMEIKSLKNPPMGVRVTLEAICIMMQKKPKRITNPETGKGKIDDYWEVAQKEVLSQGDLLDQLKKYDKENIPEKVMKKAIIYCDREDFTPEKITYGSVPAGALCKWVHAMVKFDVVAKIVRPKQAALAVANAEVKEATEMLAEKQAALQEVMNALAKLQAELDETEAAKADLARQVEDCANKLDRAQRLIGGLAGEKGRWTHNVEVLQEAYENIVGDIVLSAGAVAYLGVFTSAFRAEAIVAWSAKLNDCGITCAENFDLSNVLGDPVEIRQWNIDKLPNDAVSIHNAIMLSNSKRWPLMIDPQGQANKWVRQTHGDALKVCKQSQSDFVRTLENAINFGAPVLLENVPEALDPVLESILLRQVVRKGGMAQIQVGDNMVEYDDAFLLYITTKLRSPHYPPETCVKVNLLNFMATQEGLEDQMLGITVLKETPELAERAIQLIIQDAENKRVLKEIEDTILRLLKEAKGNILDDEVLINTLADSNKKSKEINIQVKEALKTQKLIDVTRESFKPIAFRVSSLFFCVADLAGVDPMYQYSLESYVNYYLMAIAKAAPAVEVTQRIENLKETFTLVLYENICRSLFEKDKLLFSMLLCFRIMLGDKLLDPLEMRYFMAGSAKAASMANPCETEPKWLSDYAWAQLEGLEELAGPFVGFAKEFVANLAQWHDVCNSADAQGAINELLGEKFNEFERVVVLKCIRPDVCIKAVMDFVAANIGQQFIDPPPFNIMDCYKDSTCTSPLLFVLTTGADPNVVLTKLAKEVGFGNKLTTISLGDGQGPIAEANIKEARDAGKWVCLENVHLMESWMGTLERLCEEFDEDFDHNDFRLWLTSMPSPKFPVLVLQNGVKMTLEPPAGVRANMLGSFASIDASWLEDCAKPHAFKKMIFGICFFHAVMRERGKFGPIGWNIPYTFSTADLQITRDQLKVFLDSYAEVPFDTLCYLTSECNYGGRVTDDKDRRYINNAVSDYYTASILDDAYKFSPLDEYYSPSSELDHTGIQNFIRELPMLERPEVFGLHENAGITCANQATTSLLDTALSLQTKTVGGAGKSWAEQLDESAKGIEERLPALYDMEAVLIKYPVKFEESMNTVLTMELAKFNRLLSVVKKSLAEVQRALVGDTVMSTDLETMGTSIVNGQVPDMWGKYAYPSLKPLSSWVSDLLDRLNFFELWIQNDLPPVVWITGFFFTPCFLTGTRQNYARKHKIPIDELDFDFELFHPDKGHAIKERAPDGCYINGAFLEGAGWDITTGSMVESRPKELYISMPVILLDVKKSVVRGCRREWRKSERSERSEGAVQ